jgi:hypothetical protein
LSVTSELQLPASQIRAQMAKAMPTKVGQRQVMREPRIDAFALSDRLAAPRHHDPKGDKDEPQEWEEPTIDHLSKHYVPDLKELDRGVNASST